MVLGFVSRKGDREITTSSPNPAGNTGALSGSYTNDGVECIIPSIKIFSPEPPQPTFHSFPSRAEPSLVGLRAPDADEHASGSCQIKLGGGQAQAWGNATHHRLPGKPATLALLPFQIIFKVCFSILEQTYCLGGKPNP